MRSSKVIRNAQVATRQASPFSYACPGEGIAAPEDRVKNDRLNGKQIVIKDNFMLRGTPTTCSSRMLQDFQSPYTSTAVTHLLNSGASITAKTQMDEFGMGSMTTHLPPGSAPVHNPYQPSHDVKGKGKERENRSAGGSSGGSAAAVRSGQAWAALGTDTGGSIRLPASYCGVVGLKPSYGMISRHGVVSYADTLDCVGILANSTRDVRSVYDVIAQPDHMDSTCVSSSVREKARDIYRESEGRMEGLKDGRLDGVRIGIPIETRLDESLIPLNLNPILKHLKSLGATIIPISIPSIKLALPAYYVLACAEASSNLARFGGGWYGGRGDEEGSEKPEVDLREQTRAWGFGDEVRKRILAGTHALTAGAFNNSYLKALQLRHRLRNDFNAVFRSTHPLGRLDREGSKNETPPHGVDFLLHLTTIQTAPRLDSLDTKSDGYAQDLLTVPASLAGLPCISIPGGLGDDGWPVGISLTGQWGSENGLLEVGKLGIESFESSERDV